MKMTNRNIEKEISYDYYLDMKCGDDRETISYSSLIRILTELMDRVEKLEERLNKEQEYQQEQNDSFQSTSWNR